MRLSRHNFEPSARDRLCDRVPEAGRREDVELSGQDQRRRGDLPEPSSASWPLNPSSCALKASGDCGCGKTSASSMIWSTMPVFVGPGRVDPQEERLHHRALAGRDVRQPVERNRLPSGSRRRTERKCSSGRGCGPARDGGAPAPARSDCLPRNRRRGRPVRRARAAPRPHRRPSSALTRAPRAAACDRPAVVQGDQPVAVRHAVKLWLPRLGGVAEPPEKEHVRPVSDLLDVDVDVARAQFLAQPQPSLSRALPAVHGTVPQDVERGLQAAGSRPASRRRAARPGRARRACRAAPAAHGPHRTRAPR